MKVDRNGVLYEPPDSFISVDPKVGPAELIAFLDRVSWTSALNLAIQAWDAGAAYKAATRPTCIRAAEILEREAATLFECNTYLAGPHKGEWTEECSHGDHDEMLRVAGELRKEAA